MVRGLNPSGGGWDFLHLCKLAGAHPASCTMGTMSLSKGYSGQGHDTDHPPSSNARVKKRVELHLCFPSGPSCPVKEWILPLPALNMICNMYIMPTILHQSDTCSLSICNFFFILSLTLLLVYRTSNKIRECHLKCIFLAYKIERKNKNSYERNGHLFFCWLWQNYHTSQPVSIVHTICKLNNQAARTSDSRTWNYR